MRGGRLLVLRLVTLALAVLVGFGLHMTPSGQPTFQVTPVQADIADLVITACDVDDLSNSSCNSALAADGGSSYSLAKGSHIDAPLEALTASSVSSATLHYDSWGSLSGTWGIYVKDSRDGSTICSVDPAPEDGSETNNSVGCNVSAAQLNSGVWVQINNDDDKSPESINLDYVRLQVDYTPATAVSISLTTDGAVAFGTLAASATEDTTASGVNDVETISVDSGPVDLVAQSTAWSDGVNTWTLGGSSGADQVFWEFSPDGSSWTTFAAADTDYSLATNVADGGTQNMHLRITMPSSTSSFSQHSATVTVTASAP